ncbi:MAG: hypothetical protein ACYS8W_16155 [Planctomycetota bacterium]
MKHLPLKIVQQTTGKVERIPLWIKLPFLIGVCVFFTGFIGVMYLGCGHEKQNGLLESTGPSIETSESSFYGMSEDVTGESHAIGWPGQWNVVLVYEKLSRGFKVDINCIIKVNGDLRIDNTQTDIGDNNNEFSIPFNACTGDIVCITITRRLAGNDSKSEVTAKSRLTSYIKAPQGIPPEWLIFIGRKFGLTVIGFGFVLVCVSVFIFFLWRYKIHNRVQM